MKPTPYRTVGVALALALITGAELALCLRAGTEIAAKMFETAAWANVISLAAVAAKVGVEKLAGGGGVKGALAALMTDAKPAPHTEVPK